MKVKFLVLLVLALAVRLYAQKQEIVVESLASYGNYQVFGTAVGDSLHVTGLEYDRDYFGKFLGGQFAYVGEVLPIVLLNQSVYTNVFGYPESIYRETLYGYGLSPVGFKLQWRENRKVQPYVNFKGGMVFFDKKAESLYGTRQNFTAHQGFGVEVNASSKWAVRLGLWSDYHISNAGIGYANPGLDVMTSDVGLVYRFGVDKP